VKADDRFYEDWIDKFNLESILRNSIMAENFSDKISSSNCGKISTHKAAVINSSEYNGQ
jgi:hypothetical protein